MCGAPNLSNVLISAFGLLTKAVLTVLRSAPISAAKGAPEENARPRSRQCNVDGWPNAREAPVAIADTVSDVPYIVEASGLTKEFKGFTAVKNVNLRIRRNTIHALIGPNGAGKTTCFNLITKFLEPTRGTIR